MNRAPGHHRPLVTIVEVVIALAVLAALAGIGVSVYRSFKHKAHQSAALDKMRALGNAFSTHTHDHQGALPADNASGSDTWANASKTENQGVWYNALPKLMGAPSVAELGKSNPAGLYDPAHPLCIPGAPYPRGHKKLATPVFAVGMNAILLSKSDDGSKPEAMLHRIQEPERTVIFLERGISGDVKTIPAQKNFDGSPKALPISFAARHAQKGCLVFADGHAELHAASDFLTQGGVIITPQERMVWTMNPDDDPN